MTTKKIKILFLAASPRDWQPVKWDVEFEKIRSQVNAGTHRGLFDLIPRFSTAPEDFCDALIEVEPDVVHFCGHGDRVEGLVFRDRSGRSQPIGNAALSRIFDCSKRKIRLVFLNTCYSARQAAALRGKVDLTIGTETAILDDVAIALAGKFYKALANGGSVRQAFAACTIKLTPRELGMVTMLQTSKGADASRPFVEPYLSFDRDQATASRFEEPPALNQIANSPPNKVIPSAGKIRNDNVGPGGMKRAAQILQDKIRGSTTAHGSSKRRRK